MDKIEIQKCFVHICMPIDYGIKNTVMPNPYHTMLQSIHTCNNFRLPNPNCYCYSATRRCTNFISLITVLDIDTHSLSDECSVVAVAHARVRDLGTS